MTARETVNCYSHDSTIRNLSINISVRVIDEERCFDFFCKVPLIEHHTSHERGCLLRARFPCFFYKLPKDNMRGVFSYVQVSPALFFILPPRGFLPFSRFPCSFLIPLRREVFFYFPRSTLLRHSILTMVTLRGRMWHLRIHDSPITSVTLVLWTQNQDKGIGTGIQDIVLVTFLITLL
jgi:hypothetical protein